MPNRKVHPHSCLLCWICTSSSALKESDYIRLGFTIQKHPDLDAKDSFHEVSELIWHFAFIKEGQCCSSPHPCHHYHLATMYSWLCGLDPSFCPLCYLLGPSVSQFDLLICQKAELVSCLLSNWIWSVGEKVHFWVHAWHRQGMGKLF